MKTSARLLRYFRAPRGQANLIAISLLMAVIAAFSVLGLRSTWFVGTIYERFPTARQQSNAVELRELAADIAAGTVAPEGVEDLSASELIVVYGVLIDDESQAVDGLLAEALWAMQSDEMILRIRRTLAVGSRPQRLRALGILGTIPDAASIDDSMSLCRFALERARRCGDDEIAAEALAVLSDLENR